MKINSNRNFSFVNLFCLISLLFFSLSFGKDKKWETQLSGNQIQQGAQLNITDPEFGLNNYVTVNKKTFVELKIDDYAGPYYWYEFVVDLKITPQLNDGSYGLAYFQKVKVTNNHYNGMGMFVDLHKHLINNAIIGAKIEIENFELHNFEINSISNTVPSNVKLTLIHEVERYYEISQTAPNFDYVIDASENSINVSWDNMPEVEEYELAWTWVDGYSNNGLNNLLSANQISLTLRDFEQNCTRIQTKNNYFKIANIYDKGYVVFRIRAVGRSLQNTDKNVYSSWNFENNSPSLRISDFDYLEILTSHEHNKNWQYQSSFAENGKKKDVVSYFDGSLRNRQTVTKINSSDKAIVGEVIYDAEGRAAIEILPVPVNDNAIKYYPNLNKNLQSKVYSYQDFTGSDDENCDLQAQGMSMSSGASNYYSENNIQRNNHQDFVPRAENFPFSQIDYSLDNTGRIRKKGGVGANHQLGTNHEMKYFYSVPSQEELNRLFGYSVGNVSHYKKNIVVDPNRQVSVSYIDPQGRTIATALSSGVPENMENLDDEGNSALHQLVSTDLLNKLEADDSDSELDNNDRYLSSNYWGSNLDGLRYDAQKVFVTEGDYTFKYKMLKNTPFNYLCNQETFYYPFLYKLHLGVTDECGNVLQSLDKNFGAGLDLSIDKSQFFDTTSGDYIQVDSNYNTNYNIDYNPTMVLGNPALGAYGITKQLTVDQEALDLFADDYIKRGIEEGCILGPQNPSVDLAPCYYTCEQCTKYYEGDTYVYEGVSYEPLTYNGLTGKEAYIQMMLASNAEFLALTLEEQTDAAILNLFRSRYEAEWNAILLECQAPCRPDGYSVGTLSVSNSMMCDLNLQTLLTDMLPSGQYGFYISDIDQNGNAGSNSQSENNPATLISDNNFTIYHINGVQTPPTSVSNEIYAAAEGTQLGKNDWRHPVLFNANGWDFGTNPPTHYLNHYYNSLGEIDYVDVQWDGYVFNPLVLNVNSPSDLIVLPNSGGIVVDAEAGLYRVEPQFLANVTDFITYIDTRESWLLSLVKYHPEFHYLDYQYKTCSITNTVTNTFDADFDGTDDTITFNSDGFDAFIGSFKSYDDAKNAGLLEDATTFFQNDPFFQFPHPKDGAIIASTSTGANGEVITSTSNITPTNMLDVKRAIMYQALMANSTGFTTLSSGTPYSDLLDNAIDGYEDTNETMAQNIYRIVFCNAPGGGGCTTPMPSTFTFTDIINTLNNLNSTSFPEASDVKDRFWQYYVSYYLGLKQKIQHSFINLYAMRLGFYNDCIGNNNQQNFNKITSVLNNYSKQKAVVNSWIDLPGDDTNDDPSIIVSTLFSENGNQLAQKEKRFLPYDALYNSEQSPEDVYNDMMNTIGTNQYENSGECPMVRDTKLFLENLIRKAQQTNGLVNTVVNPSSNYTADLFINSTSSISNPYVFFISRALLEEMGGNWVNPISEMQSTIDSGNKKITFNLSQTGLPAFDSISLEIPSSGTATSIFWNNFGSANGQWIISSVPQLVGTGYDAANQEYTFDMVVRVTGNASSLGISGTTTFRDIILKGRTKVRLTCTNGADGVSASENGNPILIDPGSSDDCNKKNFLQML